MNRKSLKEIIDLEWVREYPEVALDLIYTLLDKDKRDVDTMKTMDTALQIERGRNMLLQAINEINV